MDNSHLTTTLMALLAQDRVDRANAELQAALKFQKRVSMILNAQDPVEESTASLETTEVPVEAPATALPTSTEVAPIPEEKRDPRPAGRKRKSGSMIENMIRVMGTQVMTAGDVAEALEEAGLAPDSNNLKGYISSVFSSTKGANGEKLFRTVSRGKYIVAKAAQQNNNPQPETETYTTTENEYVSSADQLLAEQGLNVDSFQPAPAFS